jgi:cytochrome P450
MLYYWSSKTSVDSIAQDLRTLSLNILSRAGFGKSFKFQGHDDMKKSDIPSPSSSYRQSLQVILENAVLILAFGTKFLANPWLPRKFRQVHEACASFQKYMTDLYEEEKSAIAEGRTTDSNLMTSLVRASQEEAETTGGLTESEIYGNMFTFNFAGHDTTAHTFTFAVYFLAAHPDVQDWLSEEIHGVLGERQPQDWNYRADFPRLKRCLSVMFETIRLYTPVPVLKWTNNQTQSFTYKGRTIVLPPQNMIAPSYGSLQSDPRYWGSDSLNWRPSRWVKAAGGSANSIGQPGNEEMNLPVRGAFIGWSEGARDCPGRKFSQVEFVATIAVLFRHYRVDPLTMQGENIQDARQRVKDLIKNDSGSVLLLQMLHPERAPLVWTKRS